jgi:hypothetical protein
MRIISTSKHAHVAWSPLPDQPTLMACGTSAGTLSADFDTTATLDILRVNTKSAQVCICRRVSSAADVRACRSQSKDFQRPVGVATATNRFTSIAWGLTGSKSSAFPMGVIAGGLDTGGIAFWNPAKIVAYVQRCCFHGHCFTSLVVVVVRFRACSYDGCIAEQH